MKRNKDRMYEITEVAEECIWYSETSELSCLVGTIVTIERPELAYSDIKVQRTNGKDYLSRRGVIFVCLDSFTFRPLNLKDQAAIENAHGS